MCRFLVVRSTTPVLLALTIVQDLTTKPVHSIIRQAQDCRLRLDGGPTNGDGFGIGWYDEEDNGDGTTSDLPCVFQAITPAWSNKNLHRLAMKVRSPLVFAHVRASTTGSLSEENCHPWSFGSLLWMHNGGIAEFNTKIKRRLQGILSDELFNVPQGNTDSEWVWALFLQHLSKRSNIHGATFSHAHLREAMLETIAQLNAWAKEADVKEPSLLNFAVTDGRSVVATRYVSSVVDEAASLYFSTGTSFCETSPGSGEYRMRKVDKREHIILIASEPLTFEKADWLEVKSQTLVVITPKMNLLQYPIRDEFFREDEHGRDIGFAASKGMFHFSAPKSIAMGI